MAKIKGIYKSFKFITQIFVAKEREMEIGYPTDVKHVAHIGWDGPSGGSAPSWMNEFKTPPDFKTTTTAIANPRDSNAMPFSSWSSQEFDQSLARQPVSNLFNDMPSSDLPNIPKKRKKKNKTTTSSPKSTSLSVKSSRNVKTTYQELEPTPKLLQLQ